METSTVPLALIVDDDPFILMMTHDILEDAGFRIHEACTGDEAKALLHVHADEVVLLFSDVEMPGNTDGFALARFAAERWPAVEIVIASGRVAPDQDDLPDGATFIAKPFSGSDVHHHLRKNLPAHKQPAPLRCLR